ncbi:hypothetical protein IEQ34_017120 [Dendrobium chrysotoxum]|uniref:Uncharacterized protein n=1 Tax=Dendrobium chrysotoxum TaxID=161865 RepID=A0AAV7G999_DENCH|nr:hypothetical protein IEQ34_017120 [Dendrobium chrysotoxum]
MMAKKPSSCAICENSNLSSFCAGCVNYRLNECYASLRSLQSKRKSLYARLERTLEAKRKMDEQLSWKLAQKERIKKLKERLHNMQKQLSQEKAMVAKESEELKSKTEFVESALSTLKESRTKLESNSHSLKCTQEFRLMAISSELMHKQAVVVKLICKLFPMGWKKGGSYDTICGARLPRGLDPHSVPSDELSASLGYMIQLVNLVSPCLAAPTLHASGFAGSCSRIWQRDSYWEARPSSQSKEYPLFIPRQNFCSSTGDASWSERSSSNFSVSSVESEKKSSLDSAPSTSLNYSTASACSLETQKDLQKGISLLKKSVACITAYCNNIYCLDISPDASTFEAFAKVLATLSSSKEMSAVISLKMAKPKSDNQAQPLNKSIWNANSTASTSSLLESEHSMMITRSARNNLSNSAASFLYADTTEARVSETMVDGWDLIEHPILPPPSQAEDIEHWTRAMFIDASSK